MKRRSKLDLSGTAVQDKTQAAGFEHAVFVDSTAEAQHVESMENSTLKSNEKPHASPTEPQTESAQEAAAQNLDLRSNQANTIIKKHVIVVSGISLVPIPLFDLLALSGVQLKMLYNLTRLYEVPFSKNLGKSSIASLIGGVMPTSAAMTLASLAKAVPGLGTTAGMVSVSVLGSATTFAIGSVFVQHFESGGTLLDFDAKKMRAYFSGKLAEGKGVVANLKPGETQTSG